MVGYAPPAELPKITFFGDASSQDKEFMVAGGFAVAGNRIAEIEDKIAFLRDDAGIRSEFHWSDYRGGRRREGYEALVRYGFDLVQRKHAALHLIVSRFAGYDHKAKPGETRYTSVNRMYYQLCLRRVAAFYGRSREVHVRLDAGNDSADICSLRGQLCADAYRRYNTRPNCIRTIEPVDSRRVGLVQLADVIVGAVAAKVNAVPHTSPKGDLADFVLRHSGRSSWGTSTPRDAKFLTVWQFQGKSQVPRSPS